GALRAPAHARNDEVDEFSGDRLVLTAGETGEQEERGEGEHGDFFAPVRQRRDDRHVDHSRAVPRVLLVADVRTTIRIAVPQGLEALACWSGHVAGLGLELVSHVDAAVVAARQQTAIRIGARLRVAAAGPVTTGRVVQRLVV